MKTARTSIFSLGLCPGCRGGATRSTCPLVRLYRQVLAQRVCFLAFLARNRVTIFVHKYVGLKQGMVFELYCLALNQVSFLEESTFYIIINKQS